MATPQDYYVIGGLTGLGEIRFLQILSETSTIPGVQQFQGINKKTFAIYGHFRLLSTHEYAFSYKTFRRALIVKRLSHVATIIDPDRTEKDKAEVKLKLFENKQNPDEEKLSFLAKRIKKVTLIYSNQIIDNNNSFYAWAAIYINGLNQLKAELLIMPEHYLPQHVTKSEKFFKTILLPPQEIKFIEVKSAGAYTLALIED
ncbi:MAG: hypothetical protein EZS28_003790 [Streblomastix strix]|uniref:Uncharacterized protein n=1 Tax=Streblomastix strix TaxID=222440 RepID=A0A5J4X2J8_9EUKA|nr:MAG: hypothetical protein EZS28_003790 [Streblomastix strix]